LWGFYIPKANAEKHELNNLICGVMRFYKGGISYSDIQKMPIKDFFECVKYANKEIERENRGNSDGRI
jgi:hypothetical protein